MAFGTLGNKQWIHNAVHDMESFLWIILYLAITCGGPGGFCREELKLDNSEGDHIREHALLRFFDSEDIMALGKEKSHIFSATAGEEFLEDEVFIYFHPYFQTK